MTELEAAIDALDWLQEEEGEEPLAAAWEIVKAELARVTAREKQMVERWPGEYDRRRWITYCDGKYFIQGDKVSLRWFDTKAEAVRFVVGSSSEGEA